jgi:hypothetical protein
LDLVLSAIIISSMKEQVAARIDDVDAVQSFFLPVPGLRRPERSVVSCLSSSGGCEVELASYAEPPDDVVTEASPGDAGGTK